MSQERDTHFQNFAKLLWDELMAVTDGYIDVSNDGFDDEWIEKHKAIIARRAYDLVKHTVLNIDEHWLIALPYKEIPARIPDVFEWPK